MTKFRFLTILSVALFLSLCPAFSGGKPDYSGKWKLNIEKSDFGVLPAPDEVVITISHSDPKLEMVIHQVSAEGSLDASFSLTTDGKETDNQVGDADITSVMTWEGEILKLSSDIYVQGLEIDYQDSWTLSEDRTILTINRDMSSSMGTASQVLIFEKQ